MVMEQKGFSGLSKTETVVKISVAFEFWLGFLASGFISVC